MELEVEGVTRGVTTVRRSIEVKGKHLRATRLDKFLY